MGLLVIGNVDGVIIKMMRKLWCGVVDVEDGVLKICRRWYSVFGFKWFKMYLIYYF